MGAQWKSSLIQEEKKIDFFSKTSFYTMYSINNGKLWKEVSKFEINMGQRYKIFRKKKDKY